MADQKTIPGMTDKDSFAKFRDHCIETWREINGADPPWGGAEFKALKEVHKRCGEISGDVWNTFLEGAKAERFFCGMDPKKLLFSLSLFHSQTLKRQSSTSLKSANWSAASSEPPDSYVLLRRRTNELMHNDGISFDDALAQARKELFDGEGHFKGTMGRAGGTSGVPRGSSQGLGRHAEEDSRTTPQGERLGD